jgi:transcriptional regulator with XRE-family HTH domain
MTVGERIRSTRKHKFTQAQLAEAIGVHEMTMRRWESGVRVPDANDLQKLASVLDTSVAYLMGETDDPKRYTYVPSLLSGSYDLPEEEQTGNLNPRPISPSMQAYHEKSREILEKHLAESTKIVHALAALIPKDLDPVVEKQASDPEKLAIIKMLDGLNEEQIQKVHAFLSDQKQLADFLKEKGA